jgi:hypothetical protein
MYRDKVGPLPVKYVTTKCNYLAQGARGRRFQGVTRSIGGQLIPQANESIFLELYVTASL